MIKYIFFVFGLVLCLSACGPSQEELERQQRVEDSLMEIERNAAIEKTNQLLADTTTTDTITTEKVK